METTICPWCHTEIVWDEEFGPEDTCPHCNNELSGYRTITIGADDLEDEELDTEDASVQEEVSDEDLWDDDGDKDSVVPIFNTLVQFGDDYDLTRYEQSVASLLAAQLEAPECPQCHELMLHSGTQQVSGFTPATPEALGGGPVLKPPFSLNLFVCPSCFHVQHSLAQEDRIQLVRNLSTASE
ncbi:MULTISPECIES: hypothetical protein [unclassified Paenibacillus]|uniref:hypothetical protein n=1 Tax=unclassified Paenibacillus TaxID=185978 RepID=UPI00096FED89|nr:hypothetical protein [Paenibacillus sp. FSL H8-0259]OMF33291.1 hypothetical protein BK132_03520 [Paenibacillus sp. FSL H8-0259]